MLDTARLRGSWCATLLVIASLLLAVLDASNALPFGNCARTILGVVAWFACFALVLFHVRSLPAPTTTAGDTFNYNWIIRNNWIIFCTHPIIIQL